MSKRTVGIAFLAVSVAAGFAVSENQILEKHTMADMMTGPPQADEALMPVVVDIDPGPKYADDTRCFQGIPGIERAENGRLWAVWYAGGPNEGPENYVIVVTSGDDGATWSSAVLVVDPPGAVRAFDPCLWLDPSGRLWLFWAQAYHHWDGRAGVWAIVADDANAPRPFWSAPQRLCNGIMMNKPTVLGTGEWLLPAAVWDLKPNTPDKAYAHDCGKESGANVVCSKNFGATWALLGQARVPERACDEHLIVERKDGSLWMLVRTQYGIGESISTDRGKTWSPGKPSAIKHIPHARFFIRRLVSGKLLLVKHNPPDGETRSHLTAYLSEDDGLTWSGGLVLDERKGVSYPDGTQSPDGTLYVIYDYSRRGAKQILMAMFTEEDVAQGACVSDGTRLRVLVNQATGEPPKKKEE